MSKQLADEFYGIHTDLAIWVEKTWDRNELHDLFQGWFNIVHRYFL